MSKQKKIILGVILVVIVLMAIGYATVGNITLTISGKANATASGDNFKVGFTGQNTVVDPTSGSITVTATATAGATSATVNVSGLSKKDDTAYAILEIANTSNDIDATEVNVTTDAVDTAVFQIDAEMCTADGTPISNYALASGAKTYVKVSVTLLQTPTVDTSTDIDVTLTAKPAQVQ